MIDDRLKKILFFCVPYSLAILAGSLAVHFLIEPLLAIIFNERIAPFLTDLLRIDSYHSISYFFDFKNTPFRFLVAFLLGGGNLLYAARQYKPEIDSFVNRELLVYHPSQRLNTGSCLKSRSCLVGLSLFALFSILYILIGIRFSDMTGYFVSDNSCFFGADHLEPIDGWVSGHKGVHPLVLLVVMPFFSILNMIFSSTFIASLVPNAFWGALAVMVSFWVFQTIYENTKDAVLMSLIFGCSMSQLVFGSVPESYAINAGLLMLNYFLFVRSVQTKTIDYRHWLLVGILTFGVLITNFIQTVLLVSFLTFKLRKKDNPFIAVFVYIASVLGISVVLNLIQQQLFHGSHVFWRPYVYRDEAPYIAPLATTGHLTVLWEVVKNFVLVNVVAAFPGITDETTLDLEYSQQPLHYTGLGMVAMLLWLFFLIKNTVVKIRDAHNRFTFLSIIVVLMFNVALHSLYNVHEMFLYSCNYTFIVLFLASSWEKRPARVTRNLWVLFLIALVVNNAMVLQWMMCL